MERDIFWDIIDTSFVSSNGNVEIQQKLIIEKLTILSLEEIIGFEIVLRRLILEADDFGIMGVQKIIEGWVTDDPYLYFRCWVISRGQKTFETAMQQPDSLASVIEDVNEIWFEELLYVATEAYAAKTGKEEDEAFPRSIAIEQGLDYDFGDHETQGTEWRDEELPTLYPKLWEKFGTSSPFS